MDAFQITLLIATLLCALVAGLVFTFAVLVMPGLRSLSDRGYLEAFKAVDGVIQAGSPLFGLAWAGSVVALLAATGLGFGRPEGLPQNLLLGALGLYLLGVQLPTALFNLPLNKRLADLSVDEADAAELTALRGEFEGRWTRSNTARTFVACGVVVLLLLVVRSC